MEKNGVFNLNTLSNKIKAEKRLYLYKIFKSFSLSPKYTFFRDYQGRKGASKSFKIASVKKKSP